MISVKHCVQSQYSTMLVPSLFPYSCKAGMKQRWVSTASRDLHASEQISLTYRTAIVVEFPKL